MFDLTGRTALLTGASGSLGHAIGTALAKAGADVACHFFKNLRAAEALKDEIEGIGRRSVVIQGDLANPADAGQVVEKTIEQFGDLHILVNNAGVNREAILLRQKPELVDEVLKNNLASMMYVSQAAALRMAKNRWGRMIHVGSIVAHMGSTAQVAYASSKAGIEGMSRGIARDLGHRNITSNVIAPGLIDAGMSEKMPEKRREILMPMIALGRMGKPEEIGTAVVFLASEEAGYITGAVLHVNGGLFMH